jgi:hypothetical protein
VKHACVISRLESFMMGYKKAAFIFTDQLEIILVSAGH